MFDSRGRVDVPISITEDSSGGGRQLWTCVRPTCPLPPLCTRHGRPAVEYRTGSHSFRFIIFRKNLPESSAANYLFRAIAPPGIPDPLSLPLPHYSRCGTDLRLATVRPMPPPKPQRSSRTDRRSCRHCDRIDLHDLDNGRSTQHFHRSQKLQSDRISAGSECFGVHRRGLLQTCGECHQTTDVTHLHLDHGVRASGFRRDARTRSQAVTGLTGRDRFVAACASGPTHRRGW